MRLRIAEVPVSFFGMVLGVLGLGSTWRVATQLWELPAAVGETVVVIGLALWLWLLTGYIAKWLFRRPDALAEVRHPILCCFIGLVPVSTVLAGLAMLPHFPKIASACCAVGTVGTIAFSVRRQGGLWQGGRELEAITPVLLLPTVAGHFVVATAAGTLGWHGWGGLFLGVGCLTWLALESVILHRLLVGEALTPAQRPTLGISMAPPVVGLVAYLAMGGSADLVARLLLGYGLMQGLILLRLLPWIRDQEFGAGYWAFTFGATALALGAEQMVQLGGSGPELVLAPVLFVAVNVAVGTIALGSLVRLYQGRLLPAPAVTAAPQR